MAGPFKMKEFSGFGNSPAKLTKTQKRKADSNKFSEEDKELSPAGTIDQNTSLELEKKHGGNVPAKGFI